MGNGLLFAGVQQWLGDHVVSIIRGRAIVDVRWLVIGGARRKWFGASFNSHLLEGNKKIQINKRLRREREMEKEEKEKE